MKTKSPFKVFIVSCFSFFTSLSFSETILVTDSGSCEGLHILSVYQRDSGVYVTKFLEPRIVPCVAAIFPLMATAEMAYPSIALREIEVFSGFDEWSVLWENGKVVDTYNPDLGTGWVDSPVLGFIYLRNYPWVFHPQSGWLFVQEGPIDQNELSFWFLSPDQGWLWKKASMNQFYHHNSGTFIDASSFVLLGTEFNLPFGQEVTVYEEDIKIQFSEVNEDSRCPVDVICVWEGRLVVTLKVNEQDLGLSLGGMSEPSKIIDGYRITLKEVVAPIPWSRVVRNDSDYVITLLVEKESSS